MSVTWLYAETAAGRVVMHPGAPGRVVVQDPTVPVAGLLRAARAAGGVDVAGGDAPIPAKKMLFFESLMNSDMPHNDAELSQGVLHMISTLPREQVVLANVKMGITGYDRPVTGLEALVVPPDVELVCITLLEGYWEGVVALIAALRARGCRAHVAVGGVMPTLTPEHVAAHLPDVTFVCRGAGEWFVPRLAAVVGGCDIDTPFNDGQIAALLAIDGLIAIDRVASRLISARADRTITVDDLDAVALDLGWITPRHLAAGVELSTSRGCVHRCTFCSILGRESYQARSASGVLELLDGYDGHYTALFGSGPRDARGRNTLAPRNAYRVHISDDDFACDKVRAAELFTRLLATPFRLSSCQVSIADLCRFDKVLLAEPDPLLDAIVPELFDDHGAPIPSRDFVADHATRAWSSYLQIGVESFSDCELARLGKGYTRAHVRVIVAALARRRIHHDAYFILSNADTTPDDLVEVLDEVVRLKLRYPVHFHVRFPVVPRLVSYFPSASYKRRLRQGGASAFMLRGVARVEGYPEYDYPFVEHDVPCVLVEHCVEAGFFTDEQWYGGSFERLHKIARALPDADAEHLARVTDDRLRRRLFELLDEARRAARQPPEVRPADAPTEAHARAVCEAALGPIDTWITQFSRYAQGGVTRLVVIPTWQCELRCNYCYIPKQDGRVMTRATVERAILLLLSSERTALTLQFFGGEALLEWPLVQHAITWGTTQAERHVKTLDFVVSSNGVSLDAEKLTWLRGRPVKLELSLDGDAPTQRGLRPALEGDSYTGGIAGRASEILASGVTYDVIMVVHPTQVHKLAHNFRHIVGLGFRRIQINYALGKPWTDVQRATFAEQLFALAPLRGTDLVFVNAEHAPMPMRLNAEITVDWDGSVYGGNAFLHETEHKDRFRRGHLDDRHSFDRYWMDAPANSELVAWSYPADVTANNLKIGAILTDFVRWWRR
jgi:hypothetical protein